MNLAAPTAETGAPIRLEMDMTDGMSMSRPSVLTGITRQFGRVLSRSDFPQQVRMAIKNLEQFH